MGKFSKKLTIYLDQNFISEIAKSESNKKVNPDFRRLYKILQKGVQDEKVVIPRSFFHDIETSIATSIKDAIRKYQGFLGQLPLNDDNTIKNYQIVSAAKRFLGEDVDKEDWSWGFGKNPDKRLQPFDIRINSNLAGLFNYSIDDALKVTNVQKNIKELNINYKSQYLAELNAERKNFINNELYTMAWLFKSDTKKMIEFVRSDYFANIPIIKIYSMMWTHLLISHNHRPIKPSDFLDIKIISTYLPYVDILATDNFMCNTIKDLGLSKEYNTEVFSSKKMGLNEFVEEMQHRLPNIAPVNVPKVSIFVLPDDKIKLNSFDFFRALGLQTGFDRYGWVELYAFDDGNMPKYKIKEPELILPFFGLQPNVQVIKFDKKECNSQQIKKVCSEHCGSDRFVLIDKYRKIPEDFTQRLTEYCNGNKDKILGYNIFKKDEKPQA